MTQGQTFVTRSGSFSTHASRKGVNLLGWEEPEAISLTEERECTKARVAQLESQLKQMKAQEYAVRTFDEQIEFENTREAIKKRLTTLTHRLRFINADLKKEAAKQDLSSCILKIMKARMTKPQWEQLVREATQLYESQE
jgi:hypothetical protein